MSTKIALFAYNFPHKKTQDFILRILAEGYKIDVIYAADAVKLSIPKATIKTKINHIGLIHPSEIAKNLGIDYVVLPHNSTELSDCVKKRKLEIGVISGARILKEHVIENFEKGIINFHPGIIPEARGLDALLWSIYNNKPLGVTSHLVDKRVDAGQLIEIREIAVYNSDTILDLSERLYEVQLDMLKTAIHRTILGDTFTLDNYGTYNRKMPAEKEDEIDEKLKGYLNSFSE